MQAPFRMSRWLGALALLGLAAAPRAEAAEISGAGATFPYPIYAKWAEAYKAKTGVSMNYQSIGSGGGIKQINAKTVDFGASDMPLKPEDLDKGGLMQWPMIMGGVVLAVNLPGVKPGDITLDGPTIANIYLGKVTKWDDPALKKLNPGASLPATAIAPLYRSDGSGTNFIFTNYLSKVSAEFKSKVGENTSVEWPVGVGGKGNEGVSALASRTAGSIGYVEYAYAAEQARLHQAGQQGRRHGGARQRQLPGRRRQCRLAEGGRLLPAAHRPAGQGQLADHRRELHPHAQGAGEAGDRQSGARLL